MKEYGDASRQLVLSMLKKLREGTYYTVVKAIVGDKKMTFSEFNRINRLVRYHLNMLANEGLVKTRKSRKGATIYYI